MRSEIRIAKRLCERVKTRYQDGYYITMLPTSKYAGYKFYVSSYFCSLFVKYAEITKSKEEGYLFILEKIDREPGKRYSRPKLSFEELQAEFVDHSAQFYSDALPQALAYLKMYANDGTRNAGRVEASYLCVGGYDKTWFYETDEKRRKLNSNGVQIIKELTPSEAVQMKEKLNRMIELRRGQHDYELCKIDYWEHYFYTVMKRTLKREMIIDITNKLDEINSCIAAEAAASQQEYEELQKYFDAFIPKGERDNYGRAAS